MKLKIIAIGLTALLLCGAKPAEKHPLNLIVPKPNEATGTAWFVDTPDETILTKITSLESAAREANPKAKPWSVYITPEAGNIKIKGWKADLDIPDDPLPEASLGRCIEWICRLHPTLQYEALDGKILISTKNSKKGSKDE